jgi:hypothetical protein
MEQINKKIELGQILIRRYMIIGERRISNYWWAIVISLGAFGFLVTGVISYIASASGENSFFNNETVPFFSSRAFNVFLWELRYFIKFILVVFNFLERWWRFQ